MLQSNVDLCTVSEDSENVMQAETAMMIVMKYIVVHENKIIQRLT